MEKLNTVQGEVRLILETRPESRSSDEVLYALYLERHGVSNQSVASFLFNFKAYGVSDFESVTRCRRKIFERCPELRPDDKVNELRDIRQLEFIELSRS